MTDIQIPTVSSGAPEGAPAAPAAGPDTSGVITPDQIAAAQAVQATQQPAPAVEPVAAPAPTLSPEASSYAAERAAFVTGSEGTGQSLPSNFEDFGSYFDALKGAQGDFTRARQEIAELKAQMDGTAAPVADEATEEVAVEADPNPLQDNDQLQIPEPSVEEEAGAETNEAGDDEYEIIEVGVDEDTWNNWGAELDSTGSMSTETREQVYKAFPGVTDEMIDMYVAGRAAQMQQSFSAASEIVGSGDDLNNILSWAANNMAPEERAATNAALMTPARDATLLGLKQRYLDSTTVGSRQSEPQTTPGLMNVNAPSQGQAIEAFRTTGEMQKFMNDPRYNSDGQYTNYVQQRLAASKWLYGG